MSWDKNVYYDPQKFGLEQVAQIDYSDGCYQFDYRVVWFHKDLKKYYTARDSGCSCPMPFEEINELGDLDEFSLSVIEKEAKESAADSYYSGDPVLPFLEKLRALSHQ